MKKKIGRTGERGVSLVEVLIVIVIVGIIASFAVSRMAGAKENLARQNVAREFKVALERARFDSVKRRGDDSTTRAEVTVISETSYSVKTDTNQNGVLDVAETRVVDFAYQRTVRLLLPSGINFPVSISFDRRGHAIVGDPSGAETDQFLFCGSGCTLANASRANASVVYISPTGTVTMLGGGDSGPSSSPPTVSTVGTGVGINPDVLIWDGSTLPSPVPASPTPTPASTPVATPSPTPAPSPTPTGMPAASPTPSPTPTPVATPVLPTCTRNQRVGNPPVCRCVAPWFVGSNGKCGP